MTRVNCEKVRKKLYLHIYVPLHSKGLKILKRPLKYLKGSSIELD